MVGMEVAGYNAACRTVGGDYYDFFLRPGNKMMMLVGDVAGKGLPAALLMTSLQARVQVLAEEPVDLASLVTRLNRVIASNCPGNRFITFFICELDPASGEITYCNAGHNPPLLVRCNGEVERLEGGGIVLGIMGGFQFTQHVVNLGPGDLLAMFSDGVTEAEKPGSEEDFGEDRLAQILAANLETPIETTIETVRNAVADFTNGAPAADDFTLVVARRNAA